ncbi:golgin subfamily A member 4 isoform X2 [Vespa crabro]|uniref:golgin subfamily A member 4 isoform X2 n=1 Tax=Vespa crabro TaxID=7445 RepID=UPI001F02DE00|nr:golgin subfamily A member 4 isoform X2 [Vespa crabro]
MSGSQQENASTIVCREVFDETSHPSNEEVLDYAKRLGIDPDTEAHLLPLAREGLMAALPKGWVPCYHETSGAWYYYQASTSTTTWEHPLDSVYRELVDQVRSGNRQMSVEEDSKTTAKDLESHEEATLPKDGTILRENTILRTKIPTKLAPLRKIDKSQDGRKKEERFRSRRESDTKSDIISSLSTDRAARDYTNLKFQDPNFYECPKLLDNVSMIGSTETTPITTPKKELDLKEVLKRSESLSPRHEKDWEQLSSKFSSEENIIDIDKLSASTLARSERTEKFDKEKHPSQLGQQKELTLSGGGSMFLKSNRSRDTTPSQDSAKLEDFRASAEVVVPDALKSILREKQSEDDERPLDEERKSVRFDLEKEVDIKFTYSGSEDEWDSGSEEQNPPASTTTMIDRQSTGSETSAWKTFTRSFDEDNKVDIDETNVRKNTLFTKLQPLPKSSKIVGKRFVVRNVSESEHRTQMNANEASLIKIEEIEQNVQNSTSKFENIKNIDVISKSETESSITRNTDSTSVPEKTWKTTVRLRKNSVNGSFDLARIERELESSHRSGKSKLEHSRSFEDTKMNLTVEHEKEMETLKKEFDDKLEQARKEFEENLRIKKEALKRNFEEKLIEFKREMTEKEEQEIQKLIAEMDESRAENLKKVTEELEVCYEKERLEILTSLKAELNERKRELLELRNQEMEKLENEHERDLGEEKLAKLNEFELNKQQNERIEALKNKLDKEFDDVRTELRMKQREKITKLTEEHDKCLAEILRDFRIDEGLARKMYKQRLEEIRADFSRDVEKEARKQTELAIQQECMDFEKMRCEKRLLQDKYMALKEKYMKLKNDVRLTVERRNKSRGGYTTASETERSKTERTDSSDQNTPLRSTHSTNSVANAKSTEVVARTATNEKSQSLNESEDSKSAAKSSQGFRGVVSTNSVPSSKNAAKFESDDTTTASETNANTMRRRKSLGRKTISNSKQQNATLNTTGNNNNNNNLDNPVENIRKQLEKLEHLGDQLPSNETAYTLRYPFKDKANASSELEFFRHRIHVERDSVRRAREALKQQRNAFQGRQRALKQRSARATLEQLVQEERELSDMEVSLHRTRSLLGEKVIHLRHLEQSLERVANAKRNENDATSTKNDELTLSDMSSASSGFSSTDIGTDTFIDKLDHYQESTEIIANLENLNSEIREIWSVLNKRQDSNIPPPPTLMYSYLRWLRLHPLTASTTNIQGTFGTPNIQSNILSQLTAAQPPTTTTTQNIIAQYGPNSGFTTSVGNTVEKSSSNLADRTRNLRDWLRQARVETTDIIGPGQATL